MAPSNSSMIKGSIQIPFYEPEKNELSPRAWLQIIELARTSAGKHKVKTTNNLGAEVEVEEWVWQDEQMTTNAILLMRGSASKWAEILLEKQAPELKSWSGFKRIFSERFIKVLTLSERLALLELHQKGPETVSQFHDRVVNNVNLYRQDDWEALELDSENPKFPIGYPGKKVTQAMITVSQHYYRYVIDLQVKSSFLAGLKSEIKKLVLISSAEDLDEIYQVAVRVESSLKETKKDVLVVNAEGEEVADLEELEAAAVNKNRRFIPKSNAGPSRTTPNAGKCFYCLQTGHWKKQCLSMKNDRGKGIFRTNIHAPLAKKRQTSSADINQEEAEAEAAAALTAHIDSGSNPQLEISQPWEYLNRYSM